MIEKLALYQDLLSRVEYVGGELIWRKTRLSKLVGKSVGRPDKDGYLGTKIRGRVIVVHRAIYFLFHGDLPRYLDHIDGNPRNNKIENLRPVSASQNQMNSRVNKKTASGVKGVYYCHKKEKYVSYIKRLGRQISLGSHVDKFDAICARKSAELRYHAGFFRNAQEAAA